MLGVRQTIIDASISATSETGDLHKLQELFREGNMTSANQSEGKGISRRQAAAGGLAALIVPRHVLGGRGFQAPSDTLRIAGVGVGGMGRRYLAGCPNERVVALCDVDYTFSANVFKKYPQATVYRDYRQMFDKEEKNIDAVIIGTPDHTHAFVALDALRLKKHIYCAKPLTHTIFEARAVAAAAHEAKVATQTSVQSSASEDACGTAEILLSGVIGPVREVHFWTNHPIYPAGQVRPTDTPAVPEGLDWDLWIGPAPMRPYHPRYHPWIWRAWWDFGSGTVGDMVCHAMHVFYDALQLGNPELVHASRSTMHGGLFQKLPNDKEILPPRVETPETESYACMVTWDFPARGNLPSLRLHWYDGGLRPPRPRELHPSKPLGNSGVLYVGDKGKLLTGFFGGSTALLPENRFRDFQPPPKTLRRTTGHYQEWVDACKGGPPTTCGFDLGCKMTEIALLGALACRSGKVLEWDPGGLRVTNEPTLDTLINTPYRAGWKL